MNCANCGGPIQAGQNFCNRCGQAATPSASSTPTPVPVPASPILNARPPAALPMATVPYRGNPQPSCVAKHVQTLGILWLVISGLRVVPAVVMMSLGNFRFPFLALPMRGFLGPIIGGLGVYFAVTAAVGLVAGWGLLSRQPWARIFAIVVGFLRLIDFPFGTALGIYTLWVLASPGAEVEYQRMARAV